LDNIIIFVLIFVGIFLGIAWYYQNYIYINPNYQKENEIKKLEEEKRILEQQIQETLKENSLLKENLNQAKIFNN
jgi:cell division protein YceG involved in septum cleavage